MCVLHYHFALLTKTKKMLTRWLACTVRKKIYIIDSLIFGKIFFSNPYEFSKQSLKFFCSASVTLQIYKAFVDVRILSHDGIRL